MVYCCPSWINGKATNVSEPCHQYSKSYIGTTREPFIQTWTCAQFCVPNQQHFELRVLTLTCTDWNRNTFETTCLHLLNCTKNQHKRVIKDTDIQWIEDTCSSKTARNRCDAYTPVPIAGIIEIPVQVMLTVDLIECTNTCTHWLDNRDTCAGNAYGWSYWMHTHQYSLIG